MVTSKDLDSSIGLQQKNNPSNQHKEVDSGPYYNIDLETDIPPINKYEFAKFIKRSIDVGQDLHYEQFFIGKTIDITGGSVKIHKGMYKLWEMMTDIFSKDTINSYHCRYDIGFILAENSFIEMTSTYNGNRRVAAINVWSTSKKDIKKFKNIIRKNFDETDNSGCVSWWFLKSNGVVDSQTINIDVEEGKESKDCYYPYIPNINNYMKDFLNSSAAILILIGPPGTGKTSLVRNFIATNKLKTNITFDEALLNKDNFFIDFITEDAELLVVEDADTMLTSRENDGNSIMSKFLNVSDGLVQVTKKKIIFTTNLSNLHNVDDALLRKGRCHGILEFRNLTKDEANIVRKEIKKPLLQENKTYPLSDIFNDGHSNTTKKRMGML